jgi:peptide/nickel transport system permease protein
VNYARYVAVRLLQSIPVLLGVSVVVFIIVRSAPGDPIVNMLGIQATDANIARLRARYGLDDPIFVQYIRWLGRVLQGDLGRSITRGGRPVLDLIISRLPATLYLAFSSMVIGVLIAIPAGVVSAVRKGSVEGYGVTVGALTGVSIPNFWLGLLLILVFARVLGWLPPGNYVAPWAAPATVAGASDRISVVVESFKHVLLPAITVGTAFAALVARQTRSSMLDNLSQDYVRFAKAKGLPERTVLVRHALRQSLLPVITVIGLQFGYLLSATVVVEQVFAWPGMGRLIYNSVLQQDYPTVQGTVLVVAALFVIVNLVVDLAYSYIDPRVSAS